MKKLVILLCSIALLSASTQQKIDETATQISQVKKLKGSTSDSLDKVAKEIIAKQKSNKKELQEIAKLTKELKNASEKFQVAKEDLSLASQTTEQLKETRQKLQDELITLTTHSITLNKIEVQDSSLVAADIVQQELLKLLSKESARKVQQLQKSLKTNKKSLSKFTKKTASLQLFITSTAEKQKRLKRKIHANEIAIKELRVKRDRYKKRLKSLLSKTEKLNATLESLKIVKQTREEKRRTLERKNRNEALLSSSKNLPAVRSIGSSYKKVKTRRYRGAKTIAPLDRYTVKKKYGTHTDPIYKIKIFNESVSLEPSRANSKVKAVFSGKVVLAKKMPMLENVVIIEHKNSLHTIYAHLDSIAPNIKKGKRIRKGTPIGRVDDELMFQVTQKNYHIDPLQLFK